MNLRLLGESNRGQAARVPFMFEVELDDTNKRKLSDNVVINLSSKITKYDKMGLSDCKKIRESLIEKD